MCDPLTAAAVAATAGGSFINRQQQNAAIQAQNRANDEAVNVARALQEAERGRQAEMEGEQRRAVMDALPKVDPAKRLAEARSRAETSGVARAADAAAPRLDAGGRRDADREVAAEVNQSTARARKQIEAMAMLSALGLTGAAGGRAMGAAGQDVADLASRRRGSARVGLLETRVPAPVVRPNDSPIGDLLIMGGQAAGMYGGLPSSAPMTSPLPRARPPMLPRP